MSFESTSLNYIIQSLDDGTWKGERRWRHSPEIEQTDYVNICIDKKQLGLGGRDSWGSIPLEQYRLQYQDYDFNFMITPVFHQIPW